MRCALTSAIAAATPPSSSASTAGAVSRAGAGTSGAGAATTAAWPFPPSLPFRGQRLEQAGQPGKLAEDGAVPALEQRPPLRRDGLGVLEVLVEEQTRIAGIHAVDVVHVDVLLYQ